VLKNSNRTERRVWDCSSPNRTPRPKPVCSRRLPPWRNCPTLGRRHPCKELAFRNHEQTDEYRHKKQLADAWSAAFVSKKYFREPGRESSASGITQGHLNDLAAGRSLSADLTAEVEHLSDQYQFFHWHLAFPEVFANDGFDCVLGNPPWERVKLQRRNGLPSATRKSPMLQTPQHASG